MTDDSGSFSHIKDPEFKDALLKTKERMKDLLGIGGTDTGKALKEIFDKYTDINDKNYKPFLFEGSPGVGKSKMFEKIAESLTNKGFDPNNKIIIIEDSASIPSTTSKDYQEMLKNLPMPNINLQKRFQSLILDPLTPEQAQSIADIHIGKKGVTGEMGDIIREIAAEHIARNGTDSGARDVMNVIDDLIANPEAPEIVAKQAQRAEVRRMAASKAEGAVMAEAMRKGVTVTKRTIKPVRFK